MRRAEEARWRDMGAWSRLLMAVGALLLLRVVLYVTLSRSGYFYGIPWDTFSRTFLAYQWAQHPYFSPSDGYWVPMQFWVVGMAYRLARPLVTTSSLLIPVFVNNLFFACSLTSVYLIAHRVGGRRAALLAILLMTFHHQDIWITFSGLSEPLLIFFVLFSTLLFDRYLQSERRNASFAILIAGVALLAAATHYIGWFLAAFSFLFLGYRMIKASRPNQPGQVGAHLLGMFLSALFPLLWIGWNAVNSGDPLHFTSVARSFQAAYVGQLPLRERLLVLPRVFLSDFGIYALAGFPAAVWVASRKPAATRFLLPSGVVLLSLGASTALAFTAPYQEPRYLLVFIWVLMPFTAAMIANGLRSSRGVMRAGSLLLAMGMIIVGLWRTFAFENSFAPDTIRAAEVAGQWLERDALDGKVIIEADSFAERGVIPVVSGRPGRFVFVEPGELISARRELGLSLPSDEGKWIAIVEGDGVMEQLGPSGLHVYRIGRYFILAPEHLLNDH